MVLKLSNRVKYLLDKRRFQCQVSIAIDMPITSVSIGRIVRILYLIGMQYLMSKRKYMQKFTFKRLIKKYEINSTFNKIT